MHWLAGIAGVFFILGVLLDAFQTVIMPRRASGRYRLTRLFYFATWKPWCWVVGKMARSRRRETMLSF